MRLFCVILCLLSVHAKAQFCCGLVPPTVVPNTVINVNVWDSVRNLGKLSISKWNDWAPVQSVTGSKTSAALKDTNNVTTPIHVIINALNDYSTSSAGFGTSNTMGYPAGCFLECLFQNTSFTLTVSGVPAGHNVTVKFVCGTDNSAGGTTLNETITSGAYSSGSFNAYGNNLLAGLKTTTALPPSAGSVVFTFTGTIALLTAFTISY